MHGCAISVVAAVCGKLVVDEVEEIESIDIVCFCSWCAELGQFLSMDPAYACPRRHRWVQSGRLCMLGFDA